MNTKVKFTAGRNIAMKLPPHQYDATLQFYRDVIGLKEITEHTPSVGFEFGSNNLWLDSVPGISQAETWLEIVTNDIAAASEHLKAAGVVRCDEIEPLPEGFQAFWVSSPASIIHLVCKDSESWE
ncbi:VOC family protein [Pseudoalteromonas piscicida]|uniref:VOC family protein n=1 Tax=Pseudoalteromonas piscicida TaxID=43662 RepID=UPI001C987B88|nr:hypothetical protein [Pseudoalteromonas piscicida]QZO15617.1 hypothetical protein K5642_20430 [Pseudoalteromonas piscicida]